MSEATAELLAGVVRAFEDAVHELVGLRPDTLTFDDFADEASETVVRESLYTELVQSRMGEQVGESVRHSQPKSRLPFWTDCVALLHRIDRAVAVWWADNPGGDVSVEVTVRRLWTLTDYAWRPQDIAELKTMTRDVGAWVTTARNLLPTEAQHAWELRAACPECGERTTLVDDGSGDLIRKFTLQADKSSAKCLNCKQSWSPENYRWLARLIGADLPAGVLE